MEQLSVMLQAITAGLVAFATWLLYKIWDDVNALKVFAGVADTRLQEIDRRVTNLETIRALKAEAPHRR